MAVSDVERATIEVDGVPASYLAAGDGPMVLLLHGTYWSRVWLPALGDMAAAGLRPVAVDSRYTLNLVPALRRSSTPKLLVWGEDDTFQKVAYAERFAAEMPRTTLVRIPNAGHIPMENDPATVARALAGFFAA
jgi:pimeloyl-ACP methyl ester carboxylesterase